MSVYQLVDWMDRLKLRVCHQNITLDEINDENSVYEKILATPDTLVLELKTFEGNEPWIIGLDLETGKVVALPWWYFRLVHL